MAAASDSTSVHELVLDYLAQKGFTDAETALREHLQAAEPPPPVEGSDSISPLESMLIRGRAAAAQSRSLEGQSVLQPLSLPPAPSSDAF